MIDAVRYVVAVFVVVTIPLICFFWLFIHPFSKFWRKIKSWWTYGILFSLFVPVIFVLYYYREFLIGTNYGFHPILSITGLVFYFVAVVIYLKRRKYLTNKIMLGYPEISEKAYPGKLLTEGIYSQIRHPRYPGGCRNWGWLDRRGTWLRVPNRFSRPSAGDGAACPTRNPLH